MDEETHTETLDDRIAMRQAPFGGDIEVEEQISRILSDALLQIVNPSTSGDPEPDEARVTAIRNGLERKYRKLIDQCGLGSQYPYPDGCEWADSDIRLICERARLLRGDPVQDAPVAPSKGEVQQQCGLPRLEAILVTLAYMDAKKRDFAREEVKPDERSLIAAVERILPEETRAGLTLNLLAMNGKYRRAEGIGLLHHIIAATENEMPSDQLTALAQQMLDPLSRRLLPSLDVIAVAVEYVDGKTRILQNKPLKPGQQDLIDAVERVLPEETKNELDAFLQQSMHKISKKDKARGIRILHDIKEAIGSQMSPAELSGLAQPLEDLPRLHGKEALINAILVVVGRESLRFLKPSLTSLGVPYIPPGKSQGPDPSPGNPVADTVIVIEPDLGLKPNVIR